MSILQLSIPNEKHLAPGIVTGGQPTQQQFQAAQADGVRTIVNLCVEGECGWDERSVVEGLGMRYEAIPISGAGDITEENAKCLHEVVEDSSAYPMVIHCASGNRVGALFAAKAFHLEGCDLEAAIEQGKLAGLTKLEPALRVCLSRST